MTRIGGKYNVQKSSVGKQEGNRTLVRPRSSWKVDIKKSMKKYVAMP
jgi:hypothetical protein